MNKSLVCPHCCSATAFTPLFVTRFGDGERRLLSYTIGAKSIGAFPMEMPEARRGDLYAIIECQACSRCFVAHAIPHVRDAKAVHPVIHKTAPDEVPERIKVQFDEASLCLAVGANAACTAMCQVALESLWRDQQAKGIDDLVDKGILALALRDRAHEIRLWAGAVKHELSGEVAQEDAEELLSYLEAILDAVYVQPKRLNALREKRKQIGQK